MMAVILAGGKGTRLKPFTISIPKPLLPLDDMSILEIVICQLKAAGVTRVVITLGHLSHLFAAVLGNGEKWGIRIEYSNEDQPLGTAGPLRILKDLEDDFIVMNGDILTTIDYGALLRYHRDNRAFGTIAVSRRTVNIDYGVIRIDNDGLLNAYEEKPTIHYEVSMGINVLSREAIAHIPAGAKFDMPDLMLSLKQAGKKVACYQADCYWQDIGRLEDFQKATDDFQADRWRFLPRAD